MTTLPNAKRTVEPLTVTDVTVTGAPPAITVKFVVGAVVLPRALL